MEGKAINCGINANGDKNGTFWQLVWWLFGNHTNFFSSVSKEVGATLYHCTFPKWEFSEKFKDGTEGLCFKSVFPSSIKHKIDWAIEHRLQNSNSCLRNEDELKTDVDKTEVNKASNKVGTVMLLGKKHISEIHWQKLRSHGSLYDEKEKRISTQEKPISSPLTNY